MAFKRIDNFKGKIYIPDPSKHKKKHNCDDCFSCQFCSDERCELCLKSKCKNCKMEKNDD